MRHTTPRLTSRFAAALAVFAIALLSTPLTTLAAPGGASRLRPRQDAPAADLGPERERALYELYAAWARGERLALEEVDLLNRFVGRLGVTRLEADTVISRALFRAYVVGDRPDDEQQALLDAYLAYLAAEGREVADARVARELAAGQKVAETDAVATVPGNDQCAGAEALPGAGPFPILATAVDVSQSTRAGDPPLPACVTAPTHSIWYTFTPQQTAFYTLSTCASAPTATTVDQTAIAVFTSSGGCAGPFELLPTVDGVTVGCSNGGCFAENSQAILATQLTAGTQYFIVVWSQGALTLRPRAATIQLRVDRNLPPPNDTCAGAIPLALGVPTFGTTIGATNDYQLDAASPCFAGSRQSSTTAPGRDTVYSFTAPATATYEVRAWGEMTADDLVIYTSTTCPAATPGTPAAVSCGAASNRDTDTKAERVTLSLTSGQTVLVFVDDTARLANNFGSVYVVEASEVSLEVEPNNTPGTAGPLACGLAFDSSPINDVDFFSLGAPAAGSRVFAFVDGAAVNSGPFDMRVTTATDTLERDRGAAFFPFNGNEPIVAGTPLTGDPAFLRVNRDENGFEAAGFRLYSVVQPVIESATPETEPNNTRGSADGATNNYFYGTLAAPQPSSDTDVYRVPATAGDVLFVALDGDPLRNATPVDAKLALLDPSGNLLVEVNDAQNTSSTASGAGSLTATTPNSPAEGFVFRAPVSGTYYVRVEIGTAATVSSGAGDYLLSISKNCEIGGGTEATGAGIDTAGVYIPSTGAWFLKNANEGGAADAAFTFGAAGISIVPLSGDWDGDGVDTIGLYDSATGAFFLKNSNGGGAADIAFSFGGGGSGVTPLVGDWNGDGIDTIGLYVSATGVFFLRNANSSGGADATFTFGAGGATVVPLTGDWNGDGVDTVGIYDSGSGAFFLRNLNAIGAADVVFTFGAAGATPLTGDWDGDGTETVGIYIPSTGAWFLRNANSSGDADVVFSFGPASVTPLVGNWIGN